MNKRNSLGHTIIGIFLFMASLLSSSQANAQRLNPDGLKMVSRVCIGNNKTIDFKYDDENRLTDYRRSFTRTHPKYYQIAQLTKKSLLKTEMPLRSHHS